MSLLDSLADSHGCGSASFMMRVGNQMVEGDQGNQKDLQPVSGNISDGQGSVSRDSEDEGWYYLPRSSPVISRRQEKKMKKSVPVDSNNKTFQEQSDEKSRKGQECSWVGLSSVSKMFQNIFIEEQTIPTSPPLLDTHCTLTANKDEKCFDKQRNLSRGSSESQSSSCEERDLLNSGASQLEKETGVTCPHKRLISGEQSSLSAPNKGKYRF